MTVPRARAGNRSPEKLTKFLNGEALNEAFEKQKQHRIKLRKFTRITSKN